MWFSCTWVVALCAPVWTDLFVGCNICMSLGLFGGGAGIWELHGEKVILCAVDLCFVETHWDVSSHSLRVALHGEGVYVIKLLRTGGDKDVYRKLKLLTPLGNYDWGSHTDAFEFPQDENWKKASVVSWVGHPSSSYEPGVGIFLLRVMQKYAWGCGNKGMT